MYEENRNQGFDGNERPDEHKVEESTPNFIMKDANGETPDEFKTQIVANNQGQENQTSYHVTEKQGLEKSDSSRHIIPLEPTSRIQMKVGSKLMVQQETTTHLIPR